MPNPRFMRARSFKHVRRTSGNFTIGSAAWITLDSSLDITLDAQVGDVIEVGLSALWQGVANGGFMDVATLVTGAPITAFSSGAAQSSTSNGVSAWYGASGTEANMGGSVMRTLDASDLSNSTVTVRLYTRLTAATPTRVVYGTADNPLQVWARNLGPAQP